MTKKNEEKPTRTYGTFDAKGVISAIDDVKTGKTSKGADCKSLKMTIKTAENSSLILELFGVKKDQIEIDKFVGKKVEKKNINWESRNNIDEGWVISNMDAIRVGKNVEDAKTRGGLTQIVTFDAVDKIAEYFKIGDSIKVSGNILFQPYTNPETNNTTIFSKYALNKIYKIEDIDFDDEKYEPFAKFEQNVIIVEAQKEEDNLNVDCIIVIDKNGGYVHQNFVVKISKRPNLAKNLKKLKAYSLIPVKGDIVNKALVEEMATEDDGWGYDTQIKAVTGHDRYFEILTADGTKLEEGKYTEEDFIIVDELEELGQSVSVDGDDVLFDNKDDGSTLEDEEWL